MSFEVERRVFEAKEGENLLEVLLRLGFEVPHLCHHPVLKPWGGCRLCLVKVEGFGRPVSACSLVVKEGLKVVAVDDEELRRARGFVLGLLLSFVSEEVIPLEWMERYGVKRFRRRGKGRCVLCGRCVRVCEEVVGRGVLGLVFRGADLRVGTFFFEPSSECFDCGACEGVCPTGAIKEVLKKRIEYLRCRECGSPFVSASYFEKLSEKALVKKFCVRCKRKKTLVLREPC